MHVSAYKIHRKSTQESCTSENEEIKFPYLRNVVFLELGNWPKFARQSHRYYHTHMQHGKQREKQEYYCVKTRSSKGHRMTLLQLRVHREEQNSGRWAEAGPSWKFYNLKRTTVFRDYKHGIGHSDFQLFIKYWR